MEIRSLDLHTFSTYLFVFALGTCLVLISIALYGLYNIFLHPLNIYPGPKLWAAYRLPYVINVYQGRMPFKVLQAHRIYGSVVRIAPDELAFTDAKAWHDVQGLIPPNRHQNRKDVYVYEPLRPGSEKNIIHANDANHSRIRRIYAPAFTPRAVEEQASMLMKYANKLITSLGDAVAKNAEQDVSAWYNCASFDLTGEFAFDESFHCLDRGGTYHFFLKTVLPGIIAGMRMAQLERYGIFSMVRPLIPRSAFQASQDMTDYTAALVDRRRHQGYVPGKFDVFNYLLQDKEDKDHLTRHELIENGITLVVAGSETTAALLTGATWQLCKNPSKYRKVVDEVRSAFQNDDEITGESVRKLPYLLAVLSESMRTFPPAAFGMARIISGKGGQVVAGHHVPQGTRCSIYHYAAYRTRDNFTRPDEFIPERWLDDRPLEFASDLREVLQPFQVGPRACLGQNLAYAEMRLFLAKMLWHFDFELADAEDNWLNSLRLFAVWERTQLIVRFRPAQRSFLNSNKSRATAFCY